MAKRKPNIVDILIIVVVVALCAVAVFKFGVVNQKDPQGWMPPRSREPIRR